MAPKRIGTTPDLLQIVVVTAGGAHPYWHRGIDQDQAAANNNRTKQRADADATTKQANVNIPVSVLAFKANNGDVTQSNDATTAAKASNDNSTWQAVLQDQRAG